MEEVKLNMLVMGKTGHGKSATANTILGKKVNDTDSSTTSQTRDLSYSFVKFINYILLVVDGPGLDNLDLTQDMDKEVAAKSMDKALAMCYGGIDAFLFVFRFGSKITRQDRSSLDALKQIFGDRFMNHVIVVVTHGDLFNVVMEEEERNIGFHDWCKEQTGEFRQLFKDCDSRVVLVNNRETDVFKKSEQVRQITQLTHDLHIKAGRYTSLCFQLAEIDRQTKIKQDDQIKDQTVSKTQIKMATEELNFLLLGKSGVGKSSTGNLLLGENIFKTSVNTTSEIKDVRSSLSEFEGHKLNVVDVPGLEDTDLNPVGDMENVMTNVDKALALCNEGVDTFLFVFRFGAKFSQEDRFALQCLKQIFGGRFMDHVIVVVTAGDVFEMEMKNNKCNETFDQWWKKQGGTFRELCNDCNGRVVLVNNFEENKVKRHQQVDQIVQLADKMHLINGRYTSELFKKAETKREKLILKQKAPILKKEFQEKMYILNEDISRFSAERSNRNKSNIKAHIEELRTQIQQHDKGFGVLNDLLTQLDTLERGLHYFVKL